MRRLSTLLVLALVACGDGAAAPVGARPYAECAPVAPYSPTGGWRANCPGALGIDTARLRFALVQVDEEMPTLRALLVARRGYLALEAYWGGARAGTPLDLRSVTKAVTASVVATEIAAGRIAGIDEPMTTYYPWLAGTDDERRARVRVRHLLDLSAGYVMDTRGYVHTDRGTEILSRPMQSEPGAAWQYDEPLYDALSYLVRKVDARGVREVARAELFAPLGIAPAASRWPVDEAGNAYGAAGLRLTAREMLSLGELYLRDGAWDGRQLLPAGWVAPMRVRPPGLGSSEQVWFRGWRQVVLAGHVTIFALGWGGQYVVIVPDLDLVVVAAADPNVPVESFPPVLSLVRDHVIPSAVN